jgi:hypothetical protein
MGVATAVIAVASLLVPAMAADSVMVKDFVVRIAHAKQLPAASCDSATGSLRQAGYNLPALDCNSPLTEGNVARISNSVGIRVTTSQPDAAFSASSMDAFFGAFNDDLSGATGTDTHKEGHGTDPLEKGKGKKKGLRSPDDPV